MSNNKPGQTPGVEDEQVIHEDQSAPQTAGEREKSAAAAELSRQAGDGETSMHVRVYSPFQDYYDGSALSLSAANATGPFDILPKHHNFISLLSPCELVLRTVPAGEQRIRISGGLMHVKAN